MLGAYPHHGLKSWMLVSYIYEGMSSQMKQLEETMYEGDFMTKSSKEALQFLDYMVEVSRSWEDSLSKGTTKDKSSTKAISNGILFNS